MSLRPSLYRRLVPALLSTLAALAITRTAAADVIADGCPDDQDWCKTGNISYSRKDSLPIEWSIDTGWTPANSPLQLHLRAGVYATTSVSLTGALETRWPEALILRTPGKPGGGRLGYHYGVELKAEAKIHITVAGQDYDWTGDVPNIPQVDFQVEAAQDFDAWAFDPGITLASQTMPQRIIQVGVGDLVGGSIPGIDGGIEVDLAMELAATYTTQRIVIETTEGMAVDGGDITSQDGKTSMKYLNGPSVELDVHPEGTVDYDGVIHFIPAFYVELLGKQWSIPIADIPMAFPITQRDWVFDKERVHVPLPDVVPSVEEIDFGDVQVGQEAMVDFNVWNAGEARAKVSFVSSNPDLFPAWDTAADVESGITFDSAVRFMPTQNGPIEGTLYIASNDPSDAVQIIKLKGMGFGGPEVTPPTIEQDSGCACRIPTHTSAESNDGAMLLIGVALSLSMFRRVRWVNSDPSGSKKTQTS